MDLPEIVVRYLDAYNRLDAEALAACVTADVSFENVTNTGESISLKGRDAFAKLARTSAGLFSVRRQIVRQLVWAGDHVALEIDWAGVPAADLPGMPAGKRVSLRGATFMVLRGGLIAAITDIS